MKEWHTAAETNDHPVGRGHQTPPAFVRVLVKSKRQIKDHPMGKHSYQTWTAGDPQKKENS